MTTRHDQTTVPDTVRTGTRARPTAARADTQGAVAAAPLLALPLLAVWGLAAWGLTATSAHAQLATSPDAIQVPTVTATSPAATPAPSAPKAAQQASSPRSTRSPSATSTTAAPSPPAGPARDPMATPAASDPSTTSVASTGLSQPIDRVGSSVTVITAEDLQARQVRRGPDVLRTVPGIDVVQSGGPGDTASVFIRGTNSNHTKVFIDGIDVSNPWRIGRSFEFGDLSTLDIDRVEVLRGPQSGLYGADALGGVIAFYTPDGKGPPQVDALVEGGSFGTFLQAVGVRGSTGPVRYAFHVGHQRVDDAPPRTPLAILPAGTPRLGGAYENWTYSTKLGFDVLPNLAVNVAVRYSEADYTYQLGLRDQTPSRQASEDLHTRSEAIWSLYGGRLQTIVGITYSDLSFELAAPTFTSAGIGTRVKTDWRTVATLAPGITIVAGADWQEERLEQPLLGALPFPSQFAVDESERNQGAYLQAQIEPLRNMVIVGNVRHDDNENFGRATTWRIATTMMIEATGTQIKGSVGTAFKAPSLADRYLDYPPFFFGNRTLTPETSIGFDLGFEQALLAGHARFGATYFETKIEDLIVLSANQDTVVNLNVAEISGLEAFASADVTEDLRLRFDYTYTEPLNAKTGADLIRRPRHKGALSLGWRPFDPLLLTGTLLYVGERFDGNRVAFGDIVRQPDYTLVNVAADYKLNDNVSLIGRIDNVFDLRYEESNGFERPGLGAYAGVRVRN